MLRSRQKGFSRMYARQVSRLFFNLVPVINVPTNKRHAGYQDDRSSTEKPSDEKVILIGPATLKDETDVRMTFDV